MKYKKQLNIIFAGSIVVLLSVAYYGFADKFNGCGVDLFCFRRLLTSASYQPVSMPILVVCVSTFPLFFLKEAVYLTWKKFAVWALPIMAILIALTPARAPGAYLSLGIDREWMTIATSIVFLSISYLLIAIASFRKKK